MGGNGGQWRAMGGEYLSGFQIHGPDPLLPDPLLPVASRAGKCIPGSQIRGPDPLLPDPLLP